MHNNVVPDIAPRTETKATGSQTLKVLIAAGGTGGHVYPAIAIADALQEIHPRAEILFVGTKTHMEWETVPRAGYDITSIWISGFHRRLTARNLLFPVKLLTSLVQSLRIIRDFKPDVVVSCGGYAAGPVGWVAARWSIPLVIQEQNSFPGVTNRLLGKHANLIFTAFKEAESFFPKERVKLAGNPTRKSLTNIDKERALASFGFSSRRPTLLVLGGSGGAKSINEAMKHHLDRLHNDIRLQIIWQCGKRYYDRLREDIQPKKFAHLKLTDFLHNMPEAYAAADLVISRAGALSCSELALTGNASILVPSANVAGDHQHKNAASMVEEGAAEMLTDDKLEAMLPELVQQLITDQQRLNKMQQAALKLARPEAAQTIANEIIELIE